MKKQHRLTFEALGYVAVCERGPAGVCGLVQMLFTGALYVGLTMRGNSGRYCYESIDLALAMLQIWDGHGDPPGPWIKFTSPGAERLGPGAGERYVHHLPG